jgi:hypothetical protein
MSTRELAYGAQVFAVEAASQDDLVGFGQFFTSDTNTALALILMGIVMVGVVLIAGWLFLRALRATNRGMARRLAAPAGDPTCSCRVTGWR